MRVVVLDSLTPRIFLDEGRLAVAALRRIGYRARLKLLPEDVFARIAGNTRKVRSDLLSGGWGADYPAASDFVQLKLSCSAFHPGSDDNPNGGGFCNPRLDRRIDRARRLQVTDPARANRLWSQIDRALVDQGGLAPARHADQHHVRVRARRELPLPPAVGPAARPVLGALSGTPVGPGLTGVPSGERLLPGVRRRCDGEGSSAAGDGCRRDGVRRDTGRVARTGRRRPGVVRSQRRPEGRARVRPG
jgi:hypothetical protein